MADQSAVSVGVANLTLRQFNDRKIPFKVQKENPDTGLMEDWDLTTLHDIKMQVRYQPDPTSSLYATLTLSDGLSIIATGNNVLLADLNVSFSKDNMPSILYYDVLFQINEDDEYRTFVEGKISTDKSVTKP